MDDLGQGGHECFTTGVKSEECRDTLLGCEYGLCHLCGPRSLGKSLVPARSQFPYL